MPTLALAAIFLYVWIETFQLDSRNFVAELPVYLRRIFIVRFVPCLEFFSELFHSTYPTVETFSRHDVDADFRYIEPTAVLGRIVDLKLSGEPSGLLRGICLVE